ncbi:MAG: hypothetical protein GW949_00885 [Spirochaetales bacterium]|nr:hypothetical protein [Spirochaetales bacterium]
MQAKLTYSLLYKKKGELITLDEFPSVYEAIDYCRREGIEEPVEIRRIEVREEKMLDRTQIEQLIRKSP